MKNIMSTKEEVKIRPHSFKRGYDQLQRKDILSAKKEIMMALNITTDVAFYSRLHGRVVPRVDEAEKIESIFARYGVIEVWGR